LVRAATRNRQPQLTATRLLKLNGQRPPFQPVTYRPRTSWLRRIYKTVLGDIEALDAFGRQPWLGDAWSWLAFTSDRIPVKR
jgi:hypothetical protein